MNDNEVFQEPIHFDFADDEVATVLHILRSLAEQVSSPVVQACLTEAHDDINFLVGNDESVLTEQAEAA